jgi:hypothetical protein
MNHKIVSIITALTLTVNYVPVTANITANSEDTVLTDSGINYSEAVKTINNPGAGYTTTLWYSCKPDNTPVYNPTGNLVLMFIDIGAFSSGVNGTKDEDGNYTEGTDYDLDETFFTNLRKTFENCRNNGCTVAVRFRYDANGKTNPEPATFDKVLDHINQIKESQILDDYEDILMYVESGFVGAWGEQHSGKYTSLEYKAKLLDAMLKIVPESVPVTVRTPNTFCTWAGIQMSELADYVAEEDSDAARVGLYNDGYMGSNSDLGTFINPNRNDSVAWMKKQMLTTYYGGEFSGAIEFAQTYDTYLPENSIQEMYDTHLSYINSNIWSLYNDYTFGEEYDTSGADNSSYYGETVYKFIRDHIGYRFVLRNSNLTSNTSQGGNVTVNFSVENTGFANPIKEQNAQVILEKDGYFIITDADIDDRNWYSTQTTDETLSLKLPGNIDSGDWNVYLRLSVGDNEVTSNKRTVEFANENIYNSSLGANYLGTVHINEAENNSDNTFSEGGAENISDGTVYSYRDNINIDGVISEYEWSDEKLVAENDDSKLYLAYDNEYLYVCASFPDTAQSPVYNLSMQGDDDEKRYWIYYQSNGFVYFSGGDYSGVVCKHNGGIVEFKIPFGECMNLYSGKILNYLRVDIQDSNNSWVVTGDIRVENYQIGTSETSDNIPENVLGDVNADGVFDIADIVMLEKWLVKSGEISDLIAGDMTQDNRVNVCDLNVMKSRM